MRRKTKNQKAFLRILITGLLASAGTLSSKPAAAFNTFDCGISGEKRWRGDESENFLISNRSFPSGSDDRARVEEAFDSWTDVRGSNFKYKFTGHANRDREFKVLDGKNEVMYVSTATLLDVSDDPEVAGIAMNRNIGCRIIESDVIISNEIDKETLSSVSVHELGHALGLDHTNDYASMLPSIALSDVAHSGDHPYKPLPDDRQGLRFLYPSSYSERDVGASSFQASIDYLEYTSSYYSTFRNMCPGDAIIPVVTTLNYGTQTEEFRTKFFAAIVLAAPSYEMEEYTTTIGKNTDYTRGLALTVPHGLTPGQLYTVYQRVDSDSEISEHDESNNLAKVTRLTVDDPSDCGMSYASFARESDRLAAQNASVQRTLVSYEEALAQFRQEVARNTPQIKMGEKYAATTGIYVGVVTSVRTFRGTDGKTPYTSFGLQVSETLKGSAVRQLTLRQAGGTIGDESLQIEGAVSLNVGDEIIALIGRNERSLIPFVGGEAGVLRVVQSGNRKTVTTYRGKALVGFDGQAFELSRKPSPFLPSSLDGNLDRDDQGRIASVSILDVLSDISHKEPLSLSDVTRAIRGEIQKSGPMPVIAYQKTPAGEIRFSEATR